MTDHGRIRPLNPAVDRPVWTRLIAAVCAYSLAVIASEPLFIHPDCALHIEAAEKILRGGFAGVDAVDTNPPLIMIITAVPTAVALAIGAHPVPVFLVFTWLFTVVTTFAARRLLAGALSAREAIHADLLGLSLAVASIYRQFSYQYGQREYLFIFGVMPYLMIRFRRSEGIPVSRTAAIGWGLLAGILTCIKPQLLPVVLAPEIYWLITHRKLRTLIQPEIYGAVGAAVMYLGYLTLIPEVRDAFFGRWVPLLVQGYSAYSTTYGAIFSMQIEAWRAVGVAVVPFVLRGRPDDTAWKLARPIAIALVMAAVVYFGQRKGWTYQALPISVLACVVIGLTLAQVLTRAADTAPSPAFRSLLSTRVVALVLGLVTGIAVVGSLLALGPSTRDAQSDLLRDHPLARGIAAKTSEGDSVLVLSTNLVDFYPLLVQIRRHQASRTLYTFPVALMYHGAASVPGQPFPYRGVNGREAPFEERRYLDDLLADVSNAKPRMILVDARTPCPACPEGFTLTDYFAQNGFFAALPQYSPSGPLDVFAVYELRD